MSELNTEIPKPEIVEIQKEVKAESPEIAKRLKNDALDRRVQSYNSFAHFMSGAGVGIALSSPYFISRILGTSSYDMPPEFTIPYIAGSVTFIGGMYKFSEASLKFTSEAKIQEKHSIRNSNPDYNADRIVYKGEGLVSDGVKLNKGDNIYYVNLPVPKDRDKVEDGPTMHISPEQLGLLSRYYSLILKDLRDRISQRDFQALVLDFGFILNPSSPGLGKWGNAIEVTRNRLFEGKNIKETPQQSTTLILPREVLDALPLNPNDIYNKAIDALELEIGQKLTGKELVAGLRNLGNHSPDKRLEEANALRHRLDNLFNLTAENMFNTFPNVSIEKTPLGPIRTKSQIHPLLKITQNPKGVFLEEIAYSRGERRSVVKLDLPIEDVLLSNSKDKILLLTYALSEMLSTPEKIIEATEEEKFSPDEIRKKLFESGIFLGLPLSMPEVHPKSHKFLKGARNIALAGTLGLGAVAVVDSLPNVVELPHIITIDAPTFAGSSQGGQEGEGEGEGKVDFSSLNQLENKEKTGLGSYPESHLDWKIQAYGLSADGYYINSTSSEYEDGGWLINNKIEEAEKLDTVKLSENFVLWEHNTLRLEGIVGLDFFKNAKFRIPIRDGTSLSRFQITDLRYDKINPNSYSVYKFKDGTYLVEISLGAISSSTAVRVEYELAESETGPHATRRIKPVDPSKLSEEAYRLLQGSENNLETLRAEVSDKPYSINPPNKEVLNDIGQSPESAVNSMVELEGSDCDTSNTEFALLSSTITTTDFVNTASGYMGIVPGEKVEGQDNMDTAFLNANRSHRFSISNQGKILDATANNGSLGDEMTTKYLESLKGGSGGSAEEEWQTNWDDEIRKQELFGNIQLLLELSGLAVGLVLAPKGFEAIKRRFTKEKAEKVRYRARALRYLRRLSVSDMEEAYRFFNWMTYGQGHEFPRFSEVQVESTREETAKRIKGNIMEQNLHTYLKTPEAFETQAGITNPRKLRRIARYLVL